MGGDRGRGVEGGLGWWWDEVGVDEGGGWDGCEEEKSEEEVEGRGDLGGEVHVLRGMG